jgi:hypothetical protein
VNVALPDFLIIGAMKCGTSTLHEQLAAQDGVFMSDPKEPNFFSDDPVFAQGLAWYESLFADAPQGALKGEASTHYTKLPTYPRCADRIASALPHVRLVYVVRNRYQRLVSQYIHAWSVGELSCSLDEAVATREEFAAYSRYAMQISPYVERFGRDRILLTSQEALKADPQGELARIGVFLGARAPFRWRSDLDSSNVSSERIRPFPLYRLVVRNPVARALRRALVPKSVRETVKGRLRMRERPALSPESRALLSPVFEADRIALGDLFPDFRQPEDA